MSTASLITLASGLPCLVREISGEEEDLLATYKKRGTTGSTVIDMVFSRCVEKIGSEEGRPTPDRFLSMLSGDRRSLIYQIRALSFGNTVQFKHTCPRCEQTGTYEFNLQENLGHYSEYDPEDPKEVELLHEVTLPSGVIAVWQRSCGHDEYDAMLCGEKPSKVVTCRLVKLGPKEFPKPLNKMGKPESDRFREARQLQIASAVNALSGTDRAALRGSITANDNPVDASVEIICENLQCRQLAVRTLEDTPDFFYPGLLT